MTAYPNSDVLLESLPSDAQGYGVSWIMKSARNNLRDSAVSSSDPRVELKSYLNEANNAAGLDLVTWWSVRSTCIHVAHTF
jgi:hypothetical protein